jgi:hypothetical protein
MLLEGYLTLNVKHMNTKYVEEIIKLCKIIEANMTEAYCTVYAKQKECSWYLNDKKACEKCAWKVVIKK